MVAPGSLRLPADVILKKAQALEMDLIIVGKHGKAGWEDMLLGSVQNRFCSMRLATCLWWKGLRLGLCRDKALHEHGSVAVKKHSNQ